MATAQVATRRTRRKPNLFDQLMRAFGSYGQSIERGYRVKVYMQLSDGLNTAARNGTSSFDIMLPAGDAFGEGEVQQVTQVISRCLGARWSVIQVTRLSCRTTYCWRIFKKPRAHRRPVPSPTT